MRPNARTPEGIEFGAQMARLCESAIKGADNRCSTCAFRHGNHIANGSPETLMNAMKCVIERDPFYCHEHDRPCAGWLVMRMDAGSELQAPWDHVDGDSYKAGDVIPMPDLTGGRDE